MKSFRTAADTADERDEYSEESALFCKDPSLAVQSEGPTSDINYIVKQFGLTGELPMNRRIPLDPDVFHDAIDYRECLDIVNQAEASFGSLPADIRNKFDNDPIRFVEFALDEDNLPQLREWGLAKPVEASPVPQPPAVPPT